MTWTDQTLPSTIWSSSTQYVEFHPDKSDYEATDIPYEASGLYYEWRGAKTINNVNQMWDDADSISTIWT